MTIKTCAARMLRRIAETPATPFPLAKLAQRAAFAVSPHALTCNSCGRRFVQLSSGSLAHARQAYDHYVDAHEQTNGSAS